MGYWLGLLALCGCIAILIPTIYLWWERNSYTATLWLCPTNDIIIYDDCDAIRNNCKYDFIIVNYKDDKWQIVGFYNGNTLDIISGEYLAISVHNILLMNRYSGLQKFMKKLTL